MFAKIKIYILAACFLALFLGGAEAGAEGAGGALSDFSGNQRLRAAVWQLAAFVPAGKSGGGERTLVVEGVGGLPPVTISLTFGEPLDPWPIRLKLTFRAEDSSPPTYLTLADARPFGGPNIRLTGLSPQAARQEADNPAALLTDLLGRLNERLLKARPRLGPVTWRENAPGFEAGRTRLLYGARLGPDDLFLVRFDPARFAFRPYHEKEYPEAGQVNIGGWAERLVSASALINSGQYYPDRAYMGLLNRAGQSLSAKAHPQWKGVLVSEPKPAAPAGAPAAALIDLQDNPEARRPEDYQNAMQSFMLLDRKGNIRVRDSRNLAGRAAIGQDREGRILLIMTPAATTLYDLASALKSANLGLSQVMGLDGGFETQLLLRQNGTPFFTGGQFSITEKRAVYIPGYHPTLPAVLAVEPLVAPEVGEPEDAAATGGDPSVAPEPSEASSEADGGRSESGPRVLSYKYAHKIRRQSQ